MQIPSTKWSAFLNLHSRDLYIIETDLMNRRLITARELSRSPVIHNQVTYVKVVMSKLQYERKSRLN